MSDDPREQAICGFEMSRRQNGSNDLDSVIANRVSKQEGKMATGGMELAAMPDRAVSLWELRSPGEAAIAVCQLCRIATSW